MTAPQAAADAFVAGLLIEANRQHLTAPDLARRARVTAATVSRILDGTDNPCPTTQQRLAHALGVTPTDLYRHGTP